MSYSNANIETKPKDSEPDAEQLAREFDEEAMLRQIEEIEKFERSRTKLVKDTVPSAQPIERFKELFCCTLATVSLNLASVALKSSRFSQMDLQATKTLHKKASAQLKQASDCLNEQKKPEPKNGQISKAQSDIRDLLAETEGYCKALDDVFSTGPNSHCPDNVGLAVEARRRGIRFADLSLADYNDEKLDKTGSVEDYSGGSVHKLAKLAYKDKIGIFKPEVLTDKSDAKTGDFCGIEKSGPRYGNRNIASWVMSEALSTNMIPQSRYAIHNRQIGLLMDFAPGVRVADFKGFGPKPPSEEVIASLHKQLNELEWTDMLTGQMDRHYKNYMIDAENGQVKITGVDNDFCFGKDQDQFKEYNQPGVYRSAQKPLLMDSMAFETVSKMDFAKDVEPLLVGLLTDAEIKATASRIVEMQQHAASLQKLGFVVEDWNKWRSPKTTDDSGGRSATEFLAGRKGTLFGRDFADKIGSKA